MKKKGKQGYTMIEIMLAISIIGLLAALSIPAILGTYAKAQAKARANNIAAVEKAKVALTLPPGTMAGAMGLTTSHSFDDPAVSNKLCEALGISDLSALTVGDVPITPGTLTEKAEYL